MADVPTAIYGRNRRTSIRFFRVAVATSVVTATLFFVRTGASNSQQYALSTNLYLVLLAIIVSLAMGSAIANAYFEGGFAISLLNATAVALAFGFTTLISAIVGVDSHADAPQGLVFATFVGIAMFGGSIAWVVGNALRGLKSSSSRQ